jgi:hypothetical protein
MTSKHTNHQQDSVQPSHARPPKSQAPKRQGSSATGQAGVEPDTKPDDVVAVHGQCAEEHRAQHETEVGEAAPADDAEHGYTEEAGYAQSGGTAVKEAEPRREESGRRAKQ